MKGDFTRFTHDPEKHYTGVRKQQGRVDLDADWNEYVDIQNHIHQTTAIDVIGQCGVPEGSDGFRIETDDDGTLTISPGRIYVDGILCENEQVHSITDQPDLPGYTLPTDPGHYVVYVNVWKRHITAVEDPDLREVALGGPDTTTRVQTVCQVKLAPLELPDGDDAPRCPLPGWVPEGAASTGTLRARAQPDETSSDPCVVPAGAGYRGLENRLYRIEIHDDGRGGTSPGPTFKWSRDNGSVVFPVEAIDGNRVTLKRLGRDEVLTLHVGDWVEVLGDATELHGRPGTLVQIDEIDEAERTVSLSDSVSAYAGESHVKVRRWDHHETETVALQDGAIPIPTASDTWFPLEDGVQIQFEEERTFRTGDYWVVPARTATGGVLWPREGEEAVFQARQGILHHYCALAVVSLEEDDWEVLHDCRRRFTPLATPGVVIVEVLLEATEAPLGNDTRVALGDISDGIRIQCSEPVDENSISPVTCFVTIEIPFFNEIIIGYQPFVLAGTAEVDDDIFIIWIPEGVSSLLGNLEVEVLARLTLKGNFIWSAIDPSRYLDGEAFGTWSDEGDRDHTALDLPSGNRRRGGDFEMWFWLTPDVPTHSPQIRVDTTELVLEIRPPSGGILVEGGVEPLSSDPGTITVENTGNATLVVSIDIVSSPSPSLNFTVDTRSFSLEHGRSRTISVTFEYNGMGSLSAFGGDLVIFSNDPDSREVTVSLQGRIVSPFEPPPSP